jgi:ATP-dependent DNA helicase PIF1
MDTNHDLTEKQKLAYDLMLQGHSIFITGPSGTGKSTIIKKFVDQWGRHKKIVITSMTGISALLIGGTTLHSYLGIGLGTDSVETLTKKLQDSYFYTKRWNQIDVLIIDEVSMLSPELFDKIEEIACNLKRGRGRKLLSIEHEQPFGGIQLILSGDWLQLPVVNNDSFCFESSKWNKCIHQTVCLTEIMRQSDIEFQTVLNDIRFGKVSKRAKQLLNSRVNIDLSNDLGIEPTEIYTTNADVDRINQRELDKLNVGEIEFYEYDMEITLLEYVKNSSYVIERYRKNCIAPPVLQLCVGAQVMLLHNLSLEDGLANGSRGVVTKVIEDIPVVKFLNGEERVIDYHVWEYEENEKKIVKIKQIPLKLAWAITVHKSQGCTLDLACVNLANIFEYGMAYVALSRVKTKEGLSVIDINYEGIRAHPKAIQFYKNYNSKPV